MSYPAAPPFPASMVYDQFCIPRVARNPPNRRDEYGRVEQEQYYPFGTTRIPCFVAWLKSPPESIGVPYPAPTDASLCLIITPLPPTENLRELRSHQGYEISVYDTMYADEAFVYAGASTPIVYPDHVEFVCHPR